jgi:hypothetical protein
MPTPRTDPAYMKLRPMLDRGLMFWQKHQVLTDVELVVMRALFREGSQQKPQWTKMRNILLEEIPDGDLSIVDAAARMVSRLDANDPNMFPPQQWFEYFIAQILTEEARVIHDLAVDEMVKSEKMRGAVPPALRVTIVS